MGGSDEERPPAGPREPKSQPSEEQPGTDRPEEQPGTDRPEEQPGKDEPEERPDPDQPDQELPPVKFDDTQACQDAIIRFLDAELDHSVRDYAVANFRLSGILKAVSADNSHERLVASVGAVARAAKDLNALLLESRNYVSEDFRRPEAPDLPEFDQDVVLLAFYEVAKDALKPEGEPEDRDLRTIRRAILCDSDTRGRPLRPSGQLYLRYVHRRRIAQDIGHDPVVVAEAFDAAAFARATLQHGGGRVAAEVLLALKQSHLLIHQVERLRSKPVGGMLKRNKHDLDRERRLLEQSIVLSTLTYIVCNSAPWIFAADDREREVVQDDPERRRQDPTAPMWGAATPMWIARQVLLLSLYRRAHGYRLLGDHERSYCDHRKVQRVGLQARPGIECSGSQEKGRRNVFVDVLSALAEYRIGELYRADHDYMRALVHLCNGHDRLLAAGQPERVAAASGLLAKPQVRFPQIEVQLRLGKGNAFFETGAMKRALKWLVRAWSSLLVLIELEGKPASLEPPKLAPDRKPDLCDLVAAYLERVKHDRELDKGLLVEGLAPAIEWICGTDVPETLHALAANVLGRLGHLLMVLRLDVHDTLADLCLGRASTLDPYNLFVRTSLLRGQLRAEDRRARGFEVRRAVVDVPLDAMSCWPSGSSDVDQAIRVAEHLMICSLLKAVREDSAVCAGGDVDEARIARALIGDFIAHTDSIDLRVEVLNRYLMRERDERRRPDLGELPPTESYLEFVSLRRYGCYTPLLPRPAAVSAVGGGYLVRVCSPSEDVRVEAQRIVNILVDPGDGVVKNLYRVGLGIGDVDMVIATHDHPDHVGALDAILSLREARGDTDPLTIIGNASVIERYRGYKQLSRFRFGDPSVVLPPGVSVCSLTGRHRDLAGHDSVPFVLTYAPPGGTPRSITFMSDTATEAVGRYVEGLPKIELNEGWEEALASDIVVAHVSDVAVGELRELASLRHIPEVDKFDEAIKGLEQNGRPEDAIRVMRALSLIPKGRRDASEPRGLLDPGALRDSEDGPHLYLRGLLAVAKHMNNPPANGVERHPRILVVGELREQLGSFRRMIASEINEHIYGAAKPTVALTADIGLRVRLYSEQRNRVLCSICSMDNDRLDDERFHGPGNIIEVCVKGDHEANYWLCPIHDPVNSMRLPVFIEQMGGYDPFASGDRYHG